MNSSLHETAPTTRAGAESPRNRKKCDDQDAMPIVQDGVDCGLGVTGYEAAVDTYWNQGWPGALPFTAGTKWPPQQD